MCEDARWIFGMKYSPVPGPHSSRASVSKGRGDFRVILLGPRGRVSEESAASSGRRSTQAAAAAERGKTKAGSPWSSAQSKSQGWRIPSP